VKHMAKVEVDTRVALGIVTSKRLARPKREPYETSVQAYSVTDLPFQSA